MKYKITYQENGKLKSKVISSLEEGNENIISIQKVSSFLSSNISFFNNHDKEIASLIYEISLMLKSKLPLKDVIEILLQTPSSDFQQKILHTIDKSLQDGKPIYQSLQIEHKELGYLSILFFQLGEQNSNLEEAIYGLHTILDEKQKIKEKIKSSLQYPIILVGAFLVAIGFIFGYVVPQFEIIYSQFGSNLPYSTKVLLEIKRIVFEDFVFIGIGLFLLFGGVLLFFKNYTYKIDRIKFVSIPYFSRLFQTLIFFEFFLTISLLVKSKHKLQDALVYGKQIGDNQYFTQKISQVIDEISDGYSVSKSFANSEIFDQLTLRMIIIGENSNSLESVLEDLTSFFQKQLDKKLEHFIAFINPFLIFIISGVILWLVLAIMSPIWEMGNFIK